MTDDNSRAIYNMDYPGRLSVIRHPSSVVRHPSPEQSNSSVNFQVTTLPGLLARMRRLDGQKNATVAVPETATAPMMIHFRS